jgi:hypothetical protein
MKPTIFATSIFILLAFSMTYAQTEGTLTVTTTTSSAGGNYAPKNIVAIWIEDGQGNFIKTLLAYAETRKTHLNTWEASTTAAGSPFNTVDAITGATKTTHAARTCNWNGTDVNGNLVPDGSYKVRMELTDKNSTGNYSTFTFTKDTNPENQAPGNVPSFSSIFINWEPVITSVKDNSIEKYYHIYPNPTSGIFRVTGENIKEVQVRNVAGGLIYSGNAAVIDLTLQPDGIYLLKISSNKGTFTKKIMKKSL